MKITQELINKIVERAQKKNPHIKPETSMTLGIWAKSDVYALSHILISGFHEKYDLIDIMEATINEIIEFHEVRLKENEERLGKLEALEMGGVDNWEWYDESLEDWRKKYHS